jgi:SulP family sulfate permease
MHPSFKRYFPILDWGRRYNRQLLSNDLMAALIVTIMLIPQSLAYALLAGLPPEAGIYASIVPIVLYSIFGTSGSLAVGPVAVISLLTASTLGQIAQSGTAGYAIAAITLAGLSGSMLLIMGVLRLGGLANFLSHPVIAGFITASGVLIAVSQMRHLLGITAHGETLWQTLSTLGQHLGDTNPITLTMGAGSVAFLFWARRGLKPFMIRIGAGPTLADIATKAGPVAAVVVTTMLVAGLDLHTKGVAIVGTVPQSLPPFTIPSFAPDLLYQLFMPALMISIIGFVESISVAQTLAAKRRQRIDPDQELIGLGMANLGAAFSGGYPVTGGFSRSVVNHDAGARTPAAGAFTAVGLMIAAVALTPLVYFLPKATLAATIIVAVTSLIDLSILRRTWAYSRRDFLAVAATIVLTLGAGVEIGVASGVFLSVALHLLKTARPHVAEVGLVPETEHFRNIHRHNVITVPHMVSLRVDESLYFVNARFLENMIQDRVTTECGLTDVVLICSAVNEIDFSALESLEAINARLGDLNIGFHLSEVKGPVMDRLQKSHFIDQLNGQVFLSQFQAWQNLSGHNLSGQNLSGQNLPD